MARILGGKSIRTRILFTIRPELFQTRPFSSSSHNSKPTPMNNTNNDTSSSSSSSSSSLSQYNEQYKALKNLDFMTAAKILFTDPPKKKKFGLDFHLVQLFFVCLPSLAVYLVAQYARSEMRKMDAELERKKQAEFEAQAREMELKAAEEKAAAASNPEILEVKERLDKLEETVRQIATAPQRKPGNGTEEGNDLKQSTKTDSDYSQQGSEVVRTLKEITAASKEGKISGLAGNNKASTDKQKGSHNGGTSGAEK